MTRLRTALALVVAVATLAVAGCSSSPSKSVAATKSGTATPRVNVSNTPAAKSTKPSPQKTTQASTSKRATPAASLAPANFPYKSEVPITATVTPACILPGGTATITVQTQPDTVVAYNAIYSDNKGGSGAPYGAGYGGNDQGRSDATGRFVSNWTVGARAPAGKGRVDVVVGTDKAWGYAGAYFHVADDNGRC